MAGSNLTYTTSGTVSRLIGALLAFPPGTFKIAKSGKVCVKAGAPATNTANDQPNAKGDICYDTTNNRVYISTLNTSSSVHTWTRADA